MDIKKLFYGDIANKWYSLDLNWYFLIQKGETRKDGKRVREGRQEGRTSEAWGKELEKDK